ncbi:anaphase-promoting complex subunit 11 isoform X1 [Prunus yedoensis var. nudiflora]|uniref:Anaphase-promoting complex subunit 11 n=2 Tax=Prunus TaxID=3754 RepID=A0A314YLA5_PRUYE|nr:anaphase-promoting complex subunit 11 isoform X1 [Prunus yedoensis var. nudiflora]
MKHTPLLAISLTTISPTYHPSHSATLPITTPTNLTSISSFHIPPPLHHLPTLSLFPSPPTTTLTSLPASRTRSLSQLQEKTMKVNILQWHAVASWTWDAQDETCGICRMAFDGCCPDCKLPGDDCPLIWGACNHAFHLHCILKWVNSQTSQAHCPMCRREWHFKGGCQCRLAIV